MKTKKLAIVLTALSLSVVGIGGAAAQDDGTSTTTDQTVTIQRQLRARIHVDRDASQALKEQYTGLDAAALVEAFHSGSTLAELIEANGMSVDAYIADYVALHQAAIDAAVESGTLDADTAAELSAELVGWITDRVNAARPFYGNGAGSRNGRPGNGGRGNGGFRGDQHPGWQGGYGPLTPPTDDGAGGGQA